MSASCKPPRPRARLLTHLTLAGARGSSRERAGPEPHPSQSRLNPGSAPRVAQPRLKGTRNPPSVPPAARYGTGVSVTSTIPPPTPPRLPTLFTSARAGGDSGRPGQGKGTPSPLPAGKCSSALGGRVRLELLQSFCLALRSLPLRTWNSGSAHPGGAVHPGYCSLGWIRLLTPGTETHRGNGTL